MPIWFNIPEPFYSCLIYGVTEKVNTATYRIVVQIFRLTGIKIPVIADKHGTLKLRLIGIV